MHHSDQNRQFQPIFLNTYVAAVAEKSIWCSSIDLFFKFNCTWLGFSWSLPIPLSGTEQRRLWVKPRDFSSDIPQGSWTNSCDNFLQREFWHWRVSSFILDACFSWLDLRTGTARFQSLFRQQFYADQLGKTAGVQSNSLTWSSRAVAERVLPWLLGQTGTTCISRIQWLFQGNRGKSLFSIEGKSMQPQRLYFFFIFLFDNSIQLQHFNSSLLHRQTMRLAAAFSGSVRFARGWV